MNKAELIEKLAEKYGAASKAEAGRALEAFIDIVKNELKNGGEVAIAGFGTFKAKKRAARTARNPRTGETVQVPEKVVPVFKAGKGFKDALK
ncbi:HU family DNA-binding protein [bacterium]|nr:HU family DNA-binding protein [bacterium]